MVKQLSSYTKHTSTPSYIECLCRNDTSAQYQMFEFQHVFDFTAALVTGHKHTLYSLYCLLDAILSHMFSSRGVNTTIRYRLILQVIIIAPCDSYHQIVCECACLHRIYTDTRSPSTQTGDASPCEIMNFGLALVFVAALIGVTMADGCIDLCINKMAVSDESSDSFWLREFCAMRCLKIAEARVEAENEKADRKQGK